MDRILNPLLGQLTVEDLNQRYSESFCMYKGKPAYVHGFVSNGVSIGITFADIQTGMKIPEQETEQFAWPDLNVARPYAGWYFAQWSGKDFPFHLSYPVKRQYKRGLSPRNVHIMSPFGRPPSHGTFFNAALLDSNFAPSFITNDVLEEGRSCIPRRDRALLHQKGTFSFWYGQECVAEVKPKDNALIIYVPGFEQELYEVSHSSILNSLKVEAAPPPKQSGYLDDKLKAAIEQLRGLEPEGMPRALPQYIVEDDASWEEAKDGLRGVLFSRIASWQGRVFPRQMTPIASVIFDAEIFDDVTGEMTIKCRLVDRRRMDELLQWKRKAFTFHILVRNTMYEVNTFFVEDRDDDGDEFFGWSGEMYFTEQAHG